VTFRDVGGARKPVEAGDHGQRARAALARTV
jgi:hypothetical protein